MDEKVMIMWGDPIVGFKITGPLAPNSDHIDYVCEVALSGETWWPVPIVDPYTITPEDI